jgi:predicted helicase
VISRLHRGGRQGQCFPLSHFSHSALSSFRSHYQDDSITKLDVFHYIYALLHDPGYGTKFAEVLKKELPRMPYAPDFAAFAQAGAHLIGQVITVSLETNKNIGHLATLPFACNV